VDLRAGLDDGRKRKFLTLPGLELRLVQSVQSELSRLPMMVLKMMMMMMMMMT
jgi:hypothetical protein